MKKIIIFSFLFIILFLFVVPKYNELNNISIIEYIGIEKINNNTTYYLKEIIPKKNNYNINYTYKIHKGKSIKDIENKTNKKFYLNKVKLIITNTSDFELNISKDIFFSSNVSVYFTSKS